MRKRNQVSKLALSRETLSNLTANQIADVLGAVETYTCSSEGPYNCDTMYISLCYCPGDP